MRLERGRVGITRGRRVARHNQVQWAWEGKSQLTTYITVYFFVGCILAGQYFYNYIPAAIVAFIGLAYIALEFVPSIEPPANMRYVLLVSMYE